MNETIRRTLADISEFLNRQGAPFAVIGGIAVIVRGEPRFTADLDLVVGTDIQQALLLIQALPGSAFSTLFPDADELVKAAFILPLRHRTTRIKVDLAIGISGFEQRVIARATPVDFGGISLPVATAEDLLLMKILAGRPRDTDDAYRIVLKQGAALDWVYLLHTGRELQEAVGQDFLSQLEDLRRRMSRDP